MSKKKKDTLKTKDLSKAIGIIANWTEKRELAEARRITTNHLERVREKMKRKRKKKAKKKKKK